MTDCEYLIENAFAAYRKCGEDFEDFKESFDKEMALSKNKIMLPEVNMTVDELWEIVQYLATTYYENLIIHWWGYEI